MVTSQWRHFGISVRGPGHVRACVPNQDAFHVDTKIFKQDLKKNLVSSKPKRSCYI